MLGAVTQLQSVTEQIVPQRYHQRLLREHRAVRFPASSSIGMHAVHNRNEMMKSLPLLLAALLAVPVQSFAADAVKIDVYVAGNLKQSVSLVGPNSIVKFSPTGIPGTTLELRLIAPEPVIVEMKETTTDGGGSEVVGRIKMPTPGSSFAVAEIKGAKFHSPYVLTRAD